MYVEATCSIGAAEGHVTTSGVAAASPGEPASFLTFCFFAAPFIALTSGKWTGVRILFFHTPVALQTVNAPLLVFSSHATFGYVRLCLRW